MSAYTEWDRRAMIRKGETVKFVVRNHGRLKHEMEHEDPNAVSVGPGRTGTLIWYFARTGRFDFACLVPGHFEAGMVGKISVRP